VRILLVFAERGLNVGRNLLKLPQDLSEQNPDDIHGFLLSIRLVEDEIEESDLGGFSESVENDRTCEIRQTLTMRYMICDFPVPATN
jgi:hypothetical protein